MSRYRSRYAKQKAVAEHNAQYVTSSVEKQPLNVGTIGHVDHEPRSKAMSKDILIISGGEYGRMFAREQIEKMKDAVEKGSTWEPSPHFEYQNTYPRRYLERN